MGIFDILKMGLQNTGNSRSNNTGFSDKLNENTLNSPDKYVSSSTVSPDERPYYQPDNYYTYYSYPGTQMATRVIPFEERKRISYPSARGLYVAEIMLLEYCDSGKYPKPKSGYPGFWWFKYGIRDIGHMLQSLEQRGFIQWGTKATVLKGLKVDDLRGILATNGISTTGRKNELIDRIINSVPDQNIVISNYVPKYELTEIGKMELEDNGYVPYMHRHRHSTTEDNGISDTFTVWDINKLFPNGDARNWRVVVGNIERQRFGVDMANSEKVNKKTEDGSNLDASYSKEELRRYLAEKRTEIDKAINTPGDGYNEESQGLDLKSIGNEKDALVMFYISIGKKFDAPALYYETEKILKKYEMYEEELSVIDSELKNAKISDRRKQELNERKKTIYDLIKNR